MPATTAMQYTRPDGSTFIVARTTRGMFVIITIVDGRYVVDEDGAYKTRREAVKVGHSRLNVCGCTG